MQKKRILFVGFVNSPHAAKWISHLSEDLWDVWFFPYFDHPTSSLMPSFVQVCDSTFFLQEFGVQRDLLHETQKERVEMLSNVIKFLSPDVVNSLEFQHNTYLVQEVTESLGSRNFKWLAANWGSDINFYQFDRNHLKRIEAILPQLDGLAVECARDAKLSTAYGYSSTPILVSVVSGGIDISSVHDLEGVIPPSKRRTISVKGYEHFAGRALKSIKILENLATHLSEFDVVVYSASPSVVKYCEKIRKLKTLNLSVLPHSENSEILKLFAKSRVYLGLSVSDGLSASALEAMACGAFPIQTNTSCLGDWVNNSDNAFIVDLEDEVLIASKILRALQDDDLVDSAWERNKKLISDRFSTDFVRSVTRKYYEDLNGSL